jgi:hypothetical protein
MHIYIYIGPLSPYVTQLKRLEGLYLYENLMTGKIPLGIAHMKRLIGVYLFNNKFESKFHIFLYIRIYVCT